VPTPYTLYVATFVPVEIEIPDKCPDCGSDLAESGALAESNWQDCWIPSHVEGGEITAEGETDYGDTFMPCYLWCRRCDWLVSSTPRKES
jgi:hypothetical protein